MQPVLFIILREITANLHCVLVLIASTPEFRKDTTHPPTNFILESYDKEAQAITAARY